MLSGRTCSVTDTADTVTISLSSDAGDNEVNLPVDLVEMLAEGEESPAEVVGDLAMMGCAQRVHATIHHSQGEAPPEIVEMEGQMEELFEARFGQTYGEMTGHDH
jgi:hypothetical protein